MPSSPPCARSCSSGTPSAESLHTSAKMPGNDGSHHWLPADPEEQMSVGMRIISNAYKSIVNQLENDRREARQQLEEAKNQIAAMQQKQSVAEVELLDARQRIHVFKDENCHLISIIRKQKQKIERLESVRKAVLNSIQDSSSAAEDDAEKYLLNAEFLNDPSPSTVEASSLFPTFSNKTVSESIHQVVPSNLTNNTVILSPPNNHHTRSSSSKMPATEGLTGSVDDPTGRAFFKAVRQRVDYERFQAFIAVVRQLNAKTKTREETLTAVKKIFVDQPDLYERFTMMLRKHSIAQPEAC